MVDKCHERSYTHGNRYDKEPEQTKERTLMGECTLCGVKTDTGVIACTECDKLLSESFDDFDRMDDDYGDEW